MAVIETDEELLAKAGTTIGMVTYTAATIKRGWKIHPDEIVGVSEKGNPTYTYGNVTVNTDYMLPTLEERLQRMNEVAEMCLRYQMRHARAKAKEQETKAI